jgi:hypothetical protein
MARQLLDESGVKDQLQNKEIAYYDSTPSIKGAAEAFIDAMGKATTAARKVTYSESVAPQFGEHNDYDIIVASWGSDFPIPRATSRPNFASRTLRRAAPTSRTTTTTRLTRCWPSRTR